MDGAPGRDRNLSYHRYMETPTSLDGPARDGAWPSGPRKLSHDAARMEQHLYWSGKSVAERLAAATELTRRMYKMRGIDLDERKADFTPSRVRRLRG
jgi:hypothetical protein